MPRSKLHAVKIGRQVWGHIWRKPQLQAKLAIELPLESLRITERNQAAFTHDANPLDDLFGLDRVAGNENDSRAPHLIFSALSFPYVPPPLGCKLIRRLVKNQDWRRSGHAHGKLEKSLLAARQSRGQLIADVLKLPNIQEPLAFSRRISSTLPAQVGSEVDRFTHGQEFSARPDWAIYPT